MVVIFFELKLYGSLEKKNTHGQYTINEGGGYSFTFLAFIHERASMHSHIISWYLPLSTTDIVYCYVRPDQISLLQGFGSILKKYYTDVVT